MLRVLTERGSDACLAYGVSPREKDLPTATVVLAAHRLAEGPRGPALAFARRLGRGVAALLGEEDRLRERLRRRLGRRRLGLGLWLDGHFV